jgi:hypothetical protein
MTKTKFKTEERLPILYEAKVEFRGYEPPTTKDIYGNTTNM